VAISHIGSGAQVASATSTATPTYPASYTAVADDLALVIMGGRHDTTPPDTPTNWELLGSINGTFGNPGLRLYGKILTTSESLPAFTLNDWEFGGASVQCMILRGTELDIEAILDATTVTQSVQDSDGFGTKTPNGITTATDGSWIVQASCSEHTNALVLSSANGWTIRMSGASYDTTTGNDHAVGVATIEKATAGAQTSPEWNQSVDAWNNWVFVTIAIKEAGAGGPTEHNATVAVAFGGLAVAGAATVTKIASAAVVFGGLTVSAVARSATVTITFGGLTVAGAATVEHPATSAVAFGGLGVAAAGTVTPPSGTHNATVAVTFGGLSISSAATKTVPAVPPVAFGGLSIATAATRSTFASAAVSFGALGVTVSATKTVPASAAVAFGGLTVAAAGVIPAEIEAVSTVVFGGLSVAAVATTETPGAVTATASFVFGRLFITARVPPPGPTYLEVITARRRNMAHNVTGRTRLQTRTA
jgi:hypothetical protein